MWLDAVFGLYLGRESNPHGLCSPTDFKSVLSTYSNTQAKGAGGRVVYLHGVLFGYTPTLDQGRL
jgi:hypothetical protein